MGKSKYEEAEEINHKGQPIFPEEKIDDQVMMKRSKLLRWWWIQEKKVTYTHYTEWLQ